jgi:hypothetical protein
VDPRSPSNDGLLLPRWPPVAATRPERVARRFATTGTPDAGLGRLRVKAPPTLVRVPCADDGSRDGFHSLRRLHGMFAHPRGGFLERAVDLNTNDPGRARNPGTLAPPERRRRRHHAVDELSPSVTDTARRRCVVALCGG